jgi:class 3 adenylate cyclase
MPSAENLGRIEALTESLEALSESVELYILFIDLCNSTAIKEFCRESALPDSLWITRQKVFLGRCATIVRQYGGQVVKTIGDEVMSTFDSGSDPRSIVRCCIEVFQRFQGLRSYDKGLFKITAKASIDFGLCYDGSIDDSSRIDPIGTCVDRCARLNKQAQPVQVCLSADFRARLGNAVMSVEGIGLTSASANLAGLGFIEYFVLDLADA